MIGGDVGKGFDVVDQRRAAPEAGFGRERRARARLAAFAFDAGDQRGFFAADKRAGAEADLDVEAEGRAEDVVAQQALLFRLPDRDLAGA